MNAGKLDRRVEFFSPGVETDDGYTTVMGPPQSEGTRWARYIPAMAREIMENAGREAEMPAVFEVRSDSVTRRILPTWTMTYDGRSYNITGVQEIGRREGIRLSVVAGDASQI